MTIPIGKKSLRKLLKEPPIFTAEVVSSAPELVARALVTNPSLIIVDGSMPNWGDGLRAALTLAPRLPQTSFVLFTNRGSDEWPSNFPGEIISKNGSITELRDAIRRALQS